MSWYTCGHTARARVASCDVIQFAWIKPTRGEDIQVALSELAARSRLLNTQPSPMVPVVVHRKVPHVMCHFQHHNHSDIHELSSYAPYNNACAHIIVLDTHEWVVPFLSIRMATTRMWIVGPIFSDLDRRVSSNMRMIGNTSNSSPSMPIFNCSAVWETQTAETGLLRPLQAPLRGSWLGIGGLGGHFR